MIKDELSSIAVSAVLEDWNQRGAQTSRNESNMNKQSVYKVKMQQVADILRDGRYDAEVIPMIVAVIQDGYTYVPCADSHVLMGATKKSAAAQICKACRTANAHDYGLCPKKVCALIYDFIQPLEQNYMQECVNVYSAVNTGSMLGSLNNLLKLVLGY